MATHFDPKDKKKKVNVQYEVDLCCWISIKQLK